MALKRLIIGIILTVSLVVSAQGATVSFLVIETGLQKETPVFESSRVWENALMDVFFDTGHIVSNSPILRLYTEDNQEGLPEQARSALEDALEGGADFFVLAMLDYQHPLKLLGKEPKPQGISLRLFRTKPFKFLYSQDYSGQTEITVNDEFINAMSAVRTIISRLNDK
jgi:hypothetical protein